MNQLSLFDSARPAPEPAPPDLNFIRKTLNRALRQLRDAQWMPWDEATTAKWVKEFPELAVQLPSNETEALTARFALEIGRLQNPDAAKGGVEEG